VTRRAAPPPVRLEDLPLFAPDDQIALAVCGRNARQWPAIAEVLEREGLPKVDPLIGGRYVPAVKAWFDAQNGLGERPGAVDGPEEWDRWGKRRQA
jgi:hypothetical protein